MKKGKLIRRSFCLLLVFVFLTGIAAGCGSNTPKPDAGNKETAEQKTSDAAGNDDKKTEEKPKEAEKTPEYKFALVKGANHPYFELWAAAADDAEKDFSLPDVVLQAAQHWDQNEQNQVLDGLIAKGIKAISFMPADAVAGNQQISKMADAGINVICLAGPPAEPSKALFTFATDVYNSAYTGAKMAIEAMGGKGNLVHLAGMLTDPNTKKRMDAVKKAVSEYQDVKLYQEIGDLDVAEPAQNAVKNLMAKRSEIDGIICTAYVPSVAVATELRNFDEKRIKAVGIDTDKLVIDAIKDGYMTGTMSQNPYGQAYIGVYSMKLLADGYKWKKDNPFFIDSGTFFISKDNIDNYDEGIKQMTKKMLDEWVVKYFEAK